MKAITIHQPWATLIAIGAKQYETRHWATPYRGQIAIHAGKNKELLERTLVYMKRYRDDGLGYPSGSYEENLVAAIKAAGIAKWSDLPFGAIIAVGHLTDCVPSHKISLSAVEKTFGDFSAGRYGWWIEAVRLLPQPIVVRGQQGLWDWDEIGLKAAP